MRSSILRAAVVILTMGTAMPAYAFDFSDWEKSTDPQGVVTFDCAKFDKCGAGSRITIASAQDGPPLTVLEYQALHDKKAQTQPELKGKVTVGRAISRQVRGYDVVEIERVVGLSERLTHYAVNAIIHRAGKRHQIICSADNKELARSNYEAVLNETISYLER